MADTLTVTGQWTSAPAGTSTPLGVPLLNTPYDESIAGVCKHVDTIKLTDATETTVDFGGIADADAVILKVEGGLVTAKVSSAAGADQSFPVNPFLILFAEGTPITALSVTGEAAVAKTVHVALFHKE